jgi:hydroxypyruvate reductase
MTRKSLLLALGALKPADMAHIEERFEIIKLWDEADPEKTLRERGKDVRAILSRFNGIAVTKTMIEAMPNLELIAQYGAGVENIDRDYARMRHITVTNTPDAPTADTADLGMALLLALARRVVEGDALVRSGRWLHETLGFGTGLSGKTMGIVGMGRIGQAVAKRAEAFDMRVIYYGPREKPGLHNTYYADIAQMAEMSDVLMLTCPGGAETRNLVNDRVLEALGPNGFVVNVARGSVIDFTALEHALDNNLIAGAALDVYPTEPSRPEKLIQRDNVVLAPHIGGRTHETRDAMSRDVLNELFAFAYGKAPINPIA